MLSVHIRARAPVDKKTRFTFVERIKQKDGYLYDSCRPIIPSKHYFVEKKHCFVKKNRNRLHFFFPTLIVVDGKAAAGR